MKSKFFVMVVGVILVLFSYSSAQVPQMINYQGKLTKANGAVLDTTVQMVFSIYADSSGTILKWTETQGAVKVDKGIFNVLLGSSNPIPDTVFDGTVRYLGVRVGADPEITPRKPMVSVPYAFRAGPDGGGGNCGWVDDGTVVRLQSNTDSVGIGTTAPQARLEIAKDNRGPALLLTHPDATDAIWDSWVISALKIKAPPTPTTRNFVAGLQIETNGAAVDKGRGIHLNNWGSSDGIYVQQDGTNGTGLAILQTSGSSNSAGAVIGTVLNTQTALVLRQETALNPNAQSSCLLAAEANGSPTEMVRLNSTVAGQVGFISRMTGNNSSPFVVKNPLDVDVIRLSNNGGAYFDEKVGIGTSTPAQKLDIAGTAQMTGLKMPTGAANGYVLTSDTAGVGTWQASAGEKYWEFRITDGGADTTLITKGRWGIARYGNELYGNSVDHTHINLGVACTTGTNGQNYGYCTVGGGWRNTASNTLATVSGGYNNEASAYASLVSGGQDNLASEDWSTIGGGGGDTASAWFSTVCGGGNNTASDTAAIVGGGRYNKARGLYSVVAGGGGPAASDSNAALGDWSTIGGGFSNIASALGATISGGQANEASDYAAVAGGRLNKASNSSAVVGGGQLNVASGIFATVGGGSKDTASGNYSIVGGGYDNTSSGDSSTVGGGSRNTASATSSTVGGGWLNTASYGFATVAGGSENSAAGWGATVGGGRSNSSSHDYTTVGGGWDNTASAYLSTIGGGRSNYATGDSATIAGGVGNTASGNISTVGGGRSNTSSSWGATVGGGDANGASNWFATVGGGEYNIASGTDATVGGGYSDTASGSGSTVGGGSFNIASGNKATVGGGLDNKASGDWATVGGGYRNRNSGENSVIPGGYYDTLTASADYSMAFGSGVYVNASYRVVFFDGTYDGRLGLNRDDRDGGIDYPIHVGTDNTNGNGAHLTEGGTWTNGSSRTFKENFQPLNSQKLLEKISNLPVESWNFKNSEERHIGPMAEDFVSAFDVGTVREDGTRDNKYLASEDIAGVALAGVKELIKENQELKQMVEVLKTKLEKLESNR